MGAGVVTAILNSVLVLKGVNFDSNKGLNGGCILLNEASLDVTLSLMRNNRV